MVNAPYEPRALAPTAESSKHANMDGGVGGEGDKVVSSDKFAGLLSGGGDARKGGDARRKLLEMRCAEAMAAAGRVEGVFRRAKASSSCFQSGFLVCVGRPFGRSL